MSTGARNSTPRSKKQNDGQKSPGKEVANGSVTASLRQATGSNEKAEDTSWSVGSGKSEMDDPDTQSDDEEQTNVVTDSQAHTTTITPTLRKKFQLLYNSRGPEKFVSDWKERNNKKCNRCLSYNLPCTSSLGDRKTICNECTTTRAGTCSLTESFRKEKTMNQMGIGEDLFDSLKQLYLKDKRTSTKKRQKKRSAVKRREAAEEENVEEEDKMESHKEDVRQGSRTILMEVAETTAPDRDPTGLQHKRKRRTLSDTGELSNTTLSMPPAKKAKPFKQVSVVITKRDSYKRTERVSSGRKSPDLTVSARPSSEDQMSPSPKRFQEGRAINDVEPVDNVTKRPKRERRPTEKAKHAQVGHKKNEKYGRSRDNTTSHSTGLTSDLRPIESTTTSPRASLTTNGTKAAARSRPIPVALSGSTESITETTAIPSTSATMIATRRPLTSSAWASTSTRCVQSATLIQNTVSAPPACPHVNIPATPTQVRPVQRLPQTQPIPPSLSLSVLKRALEDISSDLRYDRSDVRGAMAQFDDVAERIGKRAALCSNSGAP
ncbi:hypothetical protein AAF712_012839 [Marasmius tenuissimus]|uniref:Uncharacterized protein n=1 Tax=Marasmius tenuissimus TaxID=585030 RepID=A0ABR2ZGG1_9AGAR